ncbi:hypothetical protein Ddye_013255 [Dipteronia dyeriana]|uniref:CAF17 C-terminal domain-containing protein n=1 Tax=Dipteronia dyeriana TaxID=168575 RepID=A0AAD9X5Z6_9ROSI|nr:hypothetical protein Ddye_013255 [Dipteronia dyeriana]
MPTESAATTMLRSQVDLLDFIDWSGVEFLYYNSSHPLPNAVKQFNICETWTMEFARRTGIARNNVNDFPLSDTVVLSSDNLKLDNIHWDNQSGFESTKVLKIALFGTTFLLRAKVETENVAEDFSCWHRYGGNLSEKSSSVEAPEAASVGWGNFPSNWVSVYYFVIMAHTKHFIYVYSKAEQKLAPGSEVIDTESGKKAGKVTTALGCHGMGSCGWSKPSEGLVKLSLNAYDFRNFPISFRHKSSVHSKNLKIPLIPSSPKEDTSAMASVE